jgi:hypothetical protein
MDDAVSEQNCIACHCWHRPDMLEGFFVRQGSSHRIRGVFFFGISCSDLKALQIILKQT